VTVDVSDIFCDVSVVFFDLRPFETKSLKFVVNVDASAILPVVKLNILY
jgi:hypothetical protein